MGGRVPLQLRLRRDKNKISEVIFHDQVRSAARTLQSMIYRLQIKLYSEQCFS